MHKTTHLRAWERLHRNQGFQSQPHLSTLHLHDEKFVQPISLKDSHWRHQRNNATLLHNEKSSVVPDTFFHTENSRAASISDSLSWSPALCHWRSLPGERHHSNTVHNHTLWARPRDDAGSVGGLDLSHAFLHLYSQFSSFLLFFTTRFNCCWFVWFSAYLSALLISFSSLVEARRASLGSAHCRMDFVCGSTRGTTWLSLCWNQSSTKNRASGT